MPEFKMDGLTDEENSKIQSEIERRVSEAIKTNTKKVTAEVTSKLNSEFDERLKAAVSEEQRKSAATDQEKIAALEAALEEQKAAFVKSNMERKTEQYLREAGLANESIVALTPLIVAGANENTLDSALETFVTTQKNAVESALSAQKQQFASNATPPASSGSNYELNPNEQLASILNQENVDPQYKTAEAIQFLFDQQS